MTQSRRPSNRSACIEKAGQPAELMLINGTSHFPLSEKDAPRTRVLIRSWLDRFFPTP